MNRIKRIFVVGLSVLGLIGLYFGIDFSGWLIAFAFLMAVSL